MKRIVIVSPGYPPLSGGVADYAARLAEGFSGVGCNVTVVTSSDLSHPREHTAVKVSPVIYDWTLRRSRSIVMEVCAAKPDAIVLQDAKERASGAYLLMVLPLLLRAAKCPLCLVVHELEGERQLLQSLLSHRVVTVEPKYNQRFKRWARVKYIPIGSNMPQPITSDRIGSRKRLGASTDQIAVGFFGFPTERKGIYDLAHAVQILNRRGQAARLVLVGQAAAVAEQMTLTCPVSTVVSVNGSLQLDEQDVANALEAVDVVALPFQDGARTRFGSLLAALQCSTPVVTTPGWPTQLDGLWECEPCKPQNLADTIFKASLGQRYPGRQPAPDWSNVARQFIDFLRS